MLVVARKESEGIEFTIGGHKVTAIVHSIKGGRVKLGIDAPQEVRIQRSEKAEEELCHKPTIITATIRG